MATRATQETATNNAKLPKQEMFTFTDTEDEEQTIESKYLLGVVTSFGASEWSLVVHVEPNSDAAVPPKVKVTTCAPDADARKPTVKADRTHIIVSTGSGGNHALEFLKEGVQGALSAVEGYEDADIHVTESESSVLEFVEEIFFPQANSGEQIRIVILSGDGGIVDLVNGLQKQPAGEKYKPPQVVILPLGTANALYHSATGGQDHTWGLKGMLTKNCAPLPTFTVSLSSGARLLVDEGRKEKELPKDESGNPILHGAVVCSWGMHASLVADSDTTEYRKFGIDRFKMAAKEALYPADGSMPHPYKAKVSVLKGETWTPLETEEHMYVLATMVSNLEKTFTISPASKPLDGSMHLVHFGPANGDEAMRIMGLAYDGGKHVDDPAVTYEAIDGLRIQFEGKEDDARWRRICVDGKIIKMEKDGWIEVRKQSRKVLDVTVI